MYKKKKKDRWMDQPITTIATTITYTQHKRREEDHIVLFSPKKNYIVLFY